MSDRPELESPEKHPEWYEPERTADPQSNGQPPPGPDPVAEIMSRPGIYTRDELDRLPPREDLIEGFLPRRGLVLLAAWRGSAKSFLAADAAGAISTGRPKFWVERSTHPDG